MSFENKCAWAIIVLFGALMGVALLLANTAYPHDCSPRTPGEHYQVGDTTGLEISAYSDGTRKSETHFRDGWRHGEHTEWHAGGQRSEHGSYDSGKRIGTWKAWYPDGANKVFVEYDSEGTLHGAYTAWYASGNLQYRETFDSGIASGTSESWHPNGCPRMLNLSDEGGTVSRRSWYDTGATRLVTAPVPGDAERLRYTSYFKDGTPESDGYRSRASGRNEGRWRYWTAAGELDSDRTRFYWGGWRLGGFFAPEADGGVPPVPPPLLAPQPYGPPWLQPPGLQPWPEPR